MRRQKDRIEEMNEQMAGELKQKEQEMEHSLS